MKIKMFNGRGTFDHLYGKKQKISVTTWKLWRVRNVCHCLEMVHTTLLRWVVSFVSAKSRYVKAKMIFYCFFKLTLLTLKYLYKHF